MLRNSSRGKSCPPQQRPEALALHAVRNFDPIASKKAGIRSAMERTELTAIRSRLILSATGECLLPGWSPGEDADRASLHSSAHISFAGPFARRPPVYGRFPNRHGRGGNAPPQVHASTSPHVPGRRCFLSNP